MNGNSNMQKAKHAEERYGSKNMRHRYLAVLVAWRSMWQPNGKEVWRTGWRKTIEDTEGQAREFGLYLG